jgi:ATP phosphoribosyltransferase
MLRSEANLVASVCADWSPATRAVARTILSRISAEEDARTSREVRAFVPKPQDLANEAQTRFGARALFGFAKDGPLRLICPAAQVAGLAEWLVEHGADHVSVSALDYLFSAHNALYEKLAARIG